MLGTLSVRHAECSCRYVTKCPHIVYSGCYVKPTVISQIISAKQQFTSIGQLTTSVVFDSDALADNLTIC